MFGLSFIHNFVLRSAQVTGRPGEPPTLPRPEADVDLLERAEEAGEGLLQMKGTPPRLAEIFGPELILARDDRRAQRPVFVRSLSPGEARLTIDP